MNLVTGALHHEGHEEHEESPWKKELPKRSFVFFVPFVVKGFVDAC
jgi:hypothetical protein